MQYYQTSFARSRALLTFPEDIVLSDVEQEYESLVAKRKCVNVYIIPEDSIFKDLMEMKHCYSFLIFMTKEQFTKGC